MLFWFIAGHATIGGNHENKNEPVHRFSLGSRGADGLRSRAPCIAGRNSIAHPCSLVKRLPVCAWEPMPHLFGAKLRALRTRRGISQMELAPHLGISRPHLNNLEAARKHATPDVIVRVAVTFQVTTDYLLRDTIPVEAMRHYLPPPAQSLTLTSRQFGAKLRHLRTIRGMTQLDLVQRLGLRSQAHISMLEADHSEPSLAMVLNLADVFGVTTDYLLRDEIPPDAVPEPPANDH